MWYDSSNAVFQVRYPIIRSIPPLSSNMPFDVLLSYIYADSLARFGSDSISYAMQMKCREWKLAGSLNDTLRNMIRGIYLMTDYDPALFEQFRGEIGLKSGRGKRYHMTIDPIIWGAESALEMGVSPEEQRAIYSVIRPDYVLRVKVLAIDSARCKTCIISDYKYRVTAQVLDTLKGRVFQQASIDQAALDGKQLDRSVAGNPSLIQFQYVLINYTDPFEATSDRPYEYMVRDSAFLAEDGRRFRMKVGQEAVVFMRHANWLLDSAADYYDIILDKWASYNGLPIIDGRVRDVNHVWSNDLYMSYEEWKERFFGLRRKILTGNYN
jgi:hypothetical protein